MSTHNIVFHGEVRKIFCGYPSYPELCLSSVQWLPAYSSQFYLFLMVALCQIFCQHILPLSQVDS